ncbi:transporter substrate-binding domain-containing protein [Microbulbifer marinus]|uniref:Membrane-bound lytic murein transglycosylase F n=1 Tax=Microbulbifer marinus TaxID=658218 RepID=A0A1H3YIV2_9GAMM|nr:transporter substrate-binding domain-containing protein [Microbulbifer marinus]SEA11455.1 membrane-bound lytic murein transglycosylase F [Microbulbifer marinus]
MKKRISPAVIFLVVALMAVIGCEQRADEKAPAVQAAPEELAESQEPAAEEAAVAVFQNYIETGDLPAMRQRGVLRLLAPRLAEDEALPRDGLPSAEWRALAEKFAHSRGLEPQWVYVDSFAELIPALTEGRGDVIATNYSRTTERAEQIAFTRPLQYVRELLVTRQGAEPAQADAEPLQVAVRRGSAFAETLSNGGEPQQRFEIAYLDEPIQHDDLLAAVADGEYMATVIDSNLAEALLPSYPHLTTSSELDSQRAIAWAVRREAPKLKRALNEFFTAEHVLASQHRERPLRDWQAIKETRTLRVLTRNHPASYFIWRGELMGFDYDLLKQFAREHKLRLSMVVPGPDVDLVEALNAGMGDMIAASLTVTDSRRQQGLVFSRPYMSVTEQVIAAGAAAAELQAQPVAELLAGKQVVVNPLTSYHGSLEKLAGEQSTPMQIVPAAGATTEQLIDAVVEGVYPYTVADSHLVAIESTYRDDFTVVGELPGERDIAWAVRGDQSQLLQQLNGFLKKHHRGLFFNVTYNKYFKETKRILRHQRDRLRSIDQLSPYDPLVREYAAAANRDWRMVVSQMYQESQFDPRAQSFAGARGLMQVLPRTARQMGISDLFVPENSIRAGVSYLEWLEQRFPRDLPFDQKIYFTLAAYNAGHGHVRDARKLAARLGKDPDLWFGNVEEAMLLLSRPEYHRQTRFGYVRGREPVNYVRQIRERYLGYLSVARNDKEIGN